MPRLAISARLVVLVCVYGIGVACQAADSETVVPLLHKESIAGKGEEMLHQGVMIQRAAIRLSQEIKFGPEGAYALSPGVYVRTSESVGWEYFAPADGADGGRVKKAPGAVTVQGAFHYSNDGKIIGMITNFYQAINTEAKGISRTTHPDWSRDKIQRILIYGGRSGSKIRVGYREVWKNIARTAGDAFVEYDLTESNVIEIRGAQVEVLEATSERIRYRVRRSFVSTENAIEE